MATDYCIWIVSPPGYLHNRCFEEVALGLQAAFAQLGHDAPVINDPAAIKGRAIVLGANLLLQLHEKLPEKLILYNLEQVQPDSPWLQPQYTELLKRYTVWDYSALNINNLRRYFSITHATLCPIGYMPALTRIGKAPQDIDVLFIGSRNDRRMHILNEIARHGKKVTAAYNSYGPERDALIARARIVINIHYYEAQVFEIVRVSYLLANRVCVVSETGHDRAMEEPLSEGIAFAPYAQLAETCLRLLANEEERQRIAEQGFETFRTRSQTPLLKSALAEL